MLAKAEFPHLTEINLRNFRTDCIDECKLGSEGARNLSKVSWPEL